MKLDYNLKINRNKTKVMVCSKEQKRKRIFGWKKNRINQQYLIKNKLKLSPFIVYSTLDNTWGRRGNVNNLFLVHHLSTVTTN